MLSKDIVRHFETRGGTLVVNWHQRSLGPERQWRDVYSALIEDIETAGGWFATGLETASWARKRRMARIEELVVDGEREVVVQTAGETDVPGLCLRIHGLNGPDGRTDDTYLPDGIECRKLLAREGVKHPKKKIQPAGLSH